MALTIAEQTELDQLRRIQGGGQGKVQPMSEQESSNLSQAEQTELTALRGIQANQPDPNIITSEDIPQAELDVMRQTEFNQRLNEDVNRRIESVRSSDPATFKDRDAIDLLLFLPEVPRTNLKQRKQITNLLKEKGVPNEAILDFLAKSDETGGLERFLQEEAVPLTGEIAGGLIGAGLTKTPRGAIGGTVIGRGIGEAGQDILESVFFPERRGTIGEEFKEAAFNTAFAGLTEGGTQAISSLLRGGSSAIRGATEGLQESLQEAGERIAPDILERINQTVGPVSDTAATLLASQRSALPILASIDNITSKSLVGQNRFAEVLKKNVGSFQQLIRETTDSIAGNLRRLDKSRVAAVFKDAVEGSGTAFDSVWQRAYSQVDNAVSRTARPVVEMVEEATGILDEAGAPLTRLVPRVVREAGDAVDVTAAKRTGQQITKLVEEGRRLGFISDEGQTFIRLTENLRDNMTFLDAQINSSDLRKIANQFDARGNKRAASLARKMASQITDAQEVAARAAGGDVLNTWRFANETFAEGKELWESAIVTQLGKDIADSPAATVEAVFKGKDPIENIKKVKKILLGTQGKTAKQIRTGQRTWRRLQRSHLQSIVEQASDIDGFLIGQNLGKILRKNQDTIVESLGKKHFDTLIDISDKGRIIQNKLQGEGGLIVRLLEAPALAGAVTGVKRGTAIATLFGAGELANILTNPKAAKTLAEGLLPLSKSTTSNIAASAKLTRQFFQSKKQLLEDRQTSAREREEDAKAAAREQLRLESVERREEAVKKRKRTRRQIQQLPSSRGIR